MRRSSILFIIFLAACIAAAVIIPSVMSRLDPNHPNADNTSVRNPVTLSGTDLQVITTDLPDMSLVVIVNEEADSIEMTYGPVNMVVDYDSSTGTLSLLGNGDDNSEEEPWARITAPSCCLSIISGISTGSVELKYLSSPSLTMAPAPSRLMLDFCEIPMVALGFMSEEVKDCSLMISNSQIDCLLSATPSDSIALMVNNSSIGLISAR